jgi:hypothetical protein
LSDLEPLDHFDQMNKVVERLLMGSNPTDIARELGLKRVAVLDFIDEWKSLVRSDNGVRERAKEALAGADQHYAMIINRAWETVDQADSNQQYNIKTQALKLIADTEQKRMDMLHKAGVLEDNELANEVLEMERKQDILVKILKEVTADCDRCRVEVARRLSQVTDRAEEIKVIQP